jgi:hypothetical protein
MAPVVRPEPDPIPKEVSHPLDAIKRSFFSLPTELRDKVYDSFFAAAKVIVIEPSDLGKPVFEDFELGQRIASGLGLLQSCRYFLSELSMHVRHTLTLYHSC